MEPWTKEEIRKALCGNGSDAERQARIQALLDALPPSGFAAVARGMAASGNPAMAVVALSTITTEFCAGREPFWGAMLAEAAHECARQITAASTATLILPSTMFLLADNHVKALSLLGRSEEVMKFADEYLALYKGTHNVTLLTLLRVSALMNLLRLDEADAALHDPKLFEDTVNGLEAYRLRRKLDDLIAWVTGVRGAAGTPEPAKIEREPTKIENELEKAFAVLQTMLSEMPRSENVRSALQNLGPLDPKRRLDPTNPAQVREMAAELDKVENMVLTRGGSDSELTVNTKIRNASLLFLDPEPAPEKIHAALATLEGSLRWACEADIHESVQGALWGIYLCHSRLKESSKAADAVLALVADLELVRKGIKDPMKKAGVFAQYPHLFKALCKMLWMSGRHSELLEAIELSKGRVIVERLSDGKGQPFDEAAIRAALGRLPMLVRREKFHYLTFFMDDERVYPSFMSNDGIIHPVEPIQITAQEIFEAEKGVNPREWGAVSLLDPRRVGMDVSARMAPLVGFLDRLVEEGVLCKDDLICYSSPPGFQNIPLHYLRFRGGMLIEFFQLARFQSTFHLDLVLGKQATGRPEAFLGLVVPSRQDVAKRGFTALEASLGEPLETLSECGLKGEVLRGKSASTTHLNEVALDRRIVHFSTHGYFPPNRTPFRDSFLLLAEEDGLSDLEKAVEGYRPADLSPAAILEQQLKFEGSHVSMMACVSGLAREGLGGDALGLDWALIQSGAASLISTHWPVSASRSAQFFTAFYRKWLSEKQSRAAAFRNTMLEMLGASPSPDVLRHTAAFSLTGEFR